MAERKEFPLVIWEGTEDFKQEYEQARGRFQDISKRLYGRGFRCTFLGDLRMDSDGYPEVWLNDNMPLCADRYCKNPDDATQYALRHGDCGWWNLDELEQFTNGEGPVFERAMWDLGYRKHKKDPTKWARKRKDDERPQFNEQKQIEEITGEELDRLNQLWAFPNESAGMSKTYDIQVGKRGLIYVALWANPFVGTTAETMWMLGEQIRNRGHIAKQQEGFYIDARNVRLGEQEGIHIKTVKPDTSYSECVWPVQTPTEKIYGLADDLVSRVK